MTINITEALKIGNDALEDSFESYREMFEQIDMDIENINTLEPAPEKSYHARSHIKLKVHGNPKYDLGFNVVAFAHGDGTGDTSRYNIGELNIPQEYKFKDRPERVFPRRKLRKDVAMEAMFPLFSVNDSGKVLNGVVCLEQLSLNHPRGDTLVRRAYLGVNPLIFRGMIKEGVSDRQVIELTTGYRRNGERFGDPHAVHYGQSITPDALQVVAFLTIKDPLNPACKLLEDISLIPDGL